MSSPNRHDSLTISVDFFCLAVSTLGLAIITPAVLFAQNPGHFLPATTYPHGYSLEQMIPKVALFESGLDPSLLHRDTPFRILHVSGNPPNKFATYAGKMFYVPLFTVDDSPLILATFPNDRGDAADESRSRPPGASYRPSLGTVNTNPATTRGLCSQST